MNINIYCPLSSDIFIIMFKMQDAENGQSLQQNERRSGSNKRQYAIAAFLMIAAFVAGSAFVLMTSNADYSTSNEIHSRQRRSQADKGEAGASVKYVRDKTNFLSLTRASNYRLLDQWKIEDSFLQSSVFELTGNRDKVTVKSPGVYLIYSQLSWTSGRKAQISYEIRVNNPKNETVVAACSDYKVEKGMKWKQSFTSVTAYLQSNDQIGLYVKNDNLTIEFAPGKSFFGLTLLYLNLNQ
ncbi:hypothetical protein CHUAL_008441 [Chamberlinius hualienensis]